MTLLHAVVIPAETKELVSLVAIIISVGVNQATQEKNVSQVNG